MRGPSHPEGITALAAAFVELLRVDVANADASPDTIRGYRFQVGHCPNWCRWASQDPAAERADDVKEYRAELVADGRKSATFARQPTIV